MLVDEENPGEPTAIKLPAATAELQHPKPKKEGSRRLWKYFSVVIVIMALVFGAFYLGTHRSQASDAQKMQGTVALSERALRNVVIAQHLTVYWIGPVSGDKYTLFIPRSGAAVVRYLPPGSIITDTSPTFRLVATYNQANAFALASAAIAQKTNLGFLNIDGNAVYYVKTRPTNVFVGLKGKDIQIEIFDPGQGQAVALALFKGQIQQIK